MNLMLPKIAHYGFNWKSLNEEDFFRICEIEQIEVLWLNDKFSWYMTIDNKAYIVLPRQVKGLPLLFKQFHELSHHLSGLSDEANTVFFHGLTNSKNEYQADAFALIALIPITDLNSYKFLEENPTRYAAYLFKERQRLNFFYGI